MINSNEILPEELYARLKEYCDNYNENVNLIVIKAVDQFISIKEEEIKFQDKFPGRPIKMRIVMEALPDCKEEERMASTLIY